MGVSWRVSAAGTGRRACSLATALLASPLLVASATGLAGCASSPLVEDAGGFHHTRHGYRIAAPPASAPPWQRVEVDGSDLAYRRAGPVWMTLSSRCRIPTARPEILARHLRIGIPEHTLRDAGAVESQGLPGWQQLFDTRRQGVVVRVKTVTLVLDRCAFDLVLSARDGAGFEGALPGFEDWWQTLRPQAAPAGSLAGPAEPAP